jgi:hypothetical protein
MIEHVLILRRDNEIDFNVTLQNCINEGWDIAGPLHVIAVSCWFSAPQLIYVQLLVKYKQGYYSNKG